STPAAIATTAPFSEKPAAKSVNPNVRIKRRRWPPPRQAKRKFINKNPINKNATGKTGGAATLN
ncbi:MAG: hypothetical protein RLO21_21340, partial [Nitratireductor sp.]